MSYNEGKIKQNVKKISDFKVGEVYYKIINTHYGMQKQRCIIKKILPTSIVYVDDKNIENQTYIGFLDSLFTEEEAGIVEVELQAKGPLTAKTYVPRWLDETYCYRCKARISKNSHRKCPRCGGYKCRACGACFCSR